MQPISRDPQVVHLDVAAGVENSITLEYDVNNIEVQVVTETGADGRVSFVEGGTANGGAYFRVAPDWWPNIPMRLPAGKEIFFRSAIDNDFKIMLHRS